jgi:N-succinyldiaminopimelate aminotransferase
VIVFSGATEGIASSILGLLNPGDEAVVFEPVYDSYLPSLAMAGAKARCVPLRFPDFEIDAEALKAAATDRTRMLILNTPMNPTGKVFRRDELTTLARFAVEHDLLVLADEVYEHLTYGDAEHVPIATLPGMRERTLTLSSTGKTFSFTGWKIGWGTGPAGLVDAAQSAHQFVTYATATPLQAAMAYALEEFTGEFLDEFRAEYTERRDFLTGALAEAGFTVHPPDGTYFILAGFADLFDGDDRAFARRLIEEHGVAAIPPSAFYPEHPEEGRKILRFAFCKTMPTLEKAAERLAGVRG